MPRRKGLAAAHLPSQQSFGRIDKGDRLFVATIPSLAVDANGNIGLGCTRTSARAFPSALVMMHAAGDPKNCMRPPVLAAKGTTVFVSTRGGKYGIDWGNYNATCRDRTDPTTLWTSQEYATSGIPDRFTTCWVAFKLANSSGHGKPIIG